MLQKGDGRQRPISSHRLPRECPLLQDSGLCRNKPNVAHRPKSGIDDKAHIKTFATASGFRQM